MTGVHGRALLLPVRVHALVEQLKCVSQIVDAGVIVRRRVLRHLVRERIILKGASLDRFGPLLGCDHILYRL